MPRKIFVVKQLSEKDCAPACLLSIIKYYNGFVPLEKIRIDAKTSISGTTAYDLIKAANKYGFDGCGYNITIKDLYENNKVYPLVAQVMYKNFSHFVVIYQVSAKNVLIMDPAKGKVTLKIDEFEKQWTGLILEFIPRNKIIIMKKDNKVFEIFLETIKLEKKLIIKIILSSLCLTVATIILSYYFKFGIDNLTTDVNLLKFICIFFFIIVLFKCLFYNLRRHYEIHFNKNLDVHLYKEFISHIFYLPSKVMATKTMGEIVTRIGDLSNLKILFSEIMMSLFLDFLMMLIAIPILFTINETLFYILSCVLIVYLLLGILFSKLIYKKILENKEYESDFNTKMIESITMFNSVKNLHKTRRVLLKIENSLANYLYHSFNIDKVNNLQFSIKYFIYEIGFFLINTVGFYLIIDNKLSITSLVTFNTLMGFFLEPIKNLIDNIPKYNFVRASIYKLNEFMNISEEVYGDKINLNKYDIVIKNLTFGYNDFTTIINKYNLRVKEKDHILIMGKSGGGKSTICKLLTKFEMDYKGDILIGNINLRDLSIATIKNNITYISQKEYLFSDTLKNNILFFRDVDFEKFNHICKLCKLDSILDNKKLRYESMIEMDSHNFSGGEKQRIILARSLLNDFKILIIDEALSEVDKKVEIEIINNLKKHFSDKTIIYISHKSLEKHFKKVVELV